MKYWTVDNKRFDDKKQAVLFLLKSFAGKNGEFCLVDTWNLYCEDKKKSDKYVYWMENLKNWVDDDPEEIIKTAHKIKGLNPKHQYFIEIENELKSSNSPANEGWIDYEKLADWLLENKDELDEFCNFAEYDE